MTERSLPGRWRRLARVVGAALALSVLIASGPTSQRAHAQDSDYDLVAVVDEVAGNTVTVTVNVDPHSAPLGALEGSLVFDPDVVMPTSCDFVGELGACNPLEDRLRFSALFLDGLTEPRALLTITFSASKSQSSTSLAFADVAGFDASTAPILAGTAPISFTTGTSSSNPLLLALPIIAVAAIGGIVALNARKRRT